MNEAIYNHHNNSSQDLTKMFSQTHSNPASQISTGYQSSQTSQIQNNLNYSHPFQIAPLVIPQFSESVPFEKQYRDQPSKLIVSDIQRSLDAKLPSRDFNNFLLPKKTPESPSSGNNFHFSYHQLPHATQQPQTIKYQQKYIGGNGSNNLDPGNQKPADSARYARPSIVLSSSNTREQYLLQNTTNHSQTQAHLGIQRNPSRPRIRNIFEDEVQSPLQNQENSRRHMPMTSNIPLGKQLKSEYSGHSHFTHSTDTRLQFSPEPKQTRYTNYGR